MPPSRPVIPPAPQPQRRTFDPWNSSSTGHQRAENRLAGSTSWRDSRTFKLGIQFQAGEEGGKRVGDLVGAGCIDFGRDGRKENGGWEKGAVGVRREMGIRDVGSMLAEGGAAEIEAERAELEKRRRDYPELIQNDARSDDIQSQGSEGEVFTGKRKEERKIFDNLCIYLNGSTYPLISDHKLKRLLAQHGARISIALGRRSVTHVIVGRPNDSSTRGSGAGGGLSGTKIQKEIDRVRGCGIKFVGVEWVLECIKAGKRVSEARFAVVSTAPKGVGSVAGMFERQKTLVSHVDKAGVAKIVAREKDEQRS